MHPARHPVGFVWQMFSSPQSGLEHIMYRKEPNPETVSSVMRDNWSGLAQVLHPRSNASASKSSSTTRLPLILVKFSKHTSSRSGNLCSQILAKFFLWPASCMDRHLRKRPLLSQDEPAIFSSAVLDVAMLCAVGNAQCKTRESP